MVENTKRESRSRLLGADMFRETFQMQVEEGSSGHRTRAGAICSVFAVVFIIAFIVQKLIIFESGSQTNMFSTESTLYFEEKDIFDYSQGFNIAVAFTAFDNDQEWILDPAYGDLIVNVEEWGRDNNDNYSLKL